MLGMKRSLLGIVLCVALFLALLLVAVADTRVVNNQVIITEPVLSFSLDSDRVGDRFTVTVIYPGATNDDACRQKTIAGIADTIINANTPFNVALQPPNIGQ